MRWIATLLLLTALTPAALAQSLQTGNITGKVSDNTGARTPGVTVTLTSPVLITPRTMATDQEGTYRFTALPPGTYALAFELAGFRKLTRSNLPVSLATTLSIDATLEEVNVSTAQHPAEVGTPGVYYNFVAKRGTDAFHGGLAYYFENHKLVSNNVTQALKDKGIGSGGGVDLFSDGTAQLGGPLIKDKLRFYTSWRDWRIHRNVPNFFKEGYFSASGQPCVTKTGTSPCTPKTENTDLRSGLVNLSYHLNPNNRIDALWTRQTYRKPNRNAGAQIQPDSTWIEDDVFSIYQAHYNSQISSNALFDVRVSFSDVSFPLFLQPGVTQPNNVELTTGDQTGAASFAYAPPQHRTRLSLNGTFSYFKGHFAGADHSFKAGYEFYRGYSSLNLDALAGINLQTFTGGPATVPEHNTPVPGTDEFTGSVLFVQDSITKDQLAVEADHRLEPPDRFLPPQR